MVERRRPLCPTSDNAVGSGSSSSANSSSPILYPIFLGRAEPRVEPGQQRSVKFRRIKPTAGGHSKAPTKLSDAFQDTDDAGRRSNTLSTYFAPSAPLRVGSGSCGRPAKLEMTMNLSSMHQSWRRPKKRLGDGHAQSRTRSHYLETFVTRIRPGTLQPPPSTIFLPSLSNPTGRDREHDPALVVAFNGRAKLLTAVDAALLGERRLLAIGGEEGAIKIVDVDATHQDDERWWSAHQNGIFDLSWCDNDRNILSASADQTLRLHDLSQGEPKLLASLRGHTSTIKSTAFLEERSSNLIASGGRDGNINLYDLRCRGFGDKSEGNETLPRRPYRTRSATETDLAVDSLISPVLMLRQPHNTTLGRRSSSDTRSVARTITSLAALRAQPGVLASGGSYDGIVKLWDIRCPEATSSLRTRSTLLGMLPDPTIRGVNPSRRPRSVNALCEQPSTGDLFVLCGDSKIHTLRPSAVNSTPLYAHEAILPKKFVHPCLTTRSFYIRMALSPDGQYLACGSSNGGVMMWDVNEGSDVGENASARRLPIPQITPETPEVIALDWAKDMIAASADDCSTRIWEANMTVAKQLQSHVSDEWSGIA